MREARVEIRGIQEVQAAIREYKGDITRSLNLIIDRAALDSVSNVRRAIQGPPKTGIEYARGKNGDKIHRASAPGEAPATDTGTLASSIYNEKRPQRNGFLRVIGSRLKYAYYLEFGTRKIEPRPSWIPAVERAIPKMLTDVRIAIAAAKARAEKTTK
jgi:hypothetical protein